MKQYCRYCFYMCCGDANYCSKQDLCFSDNYIKRINHCKDFSFCELDALNIDHIYKPRERKEENENQIKLF